MSIIRNIRNKVYLLVSLLIISFHSPASYPPFRFTTWTQSSGLSQSTLFSIIRDRQGFIWAGTQDGLNRFDGYTFTTYRQQPDKEGSLSHSWVWSVLEDNYGNIWVASYEGLNLFQRARNDFRLVMPDFVRGGNNGKFETNFLFQENDSLIWVAAWGKGLYWLDPRTKSFYPESLMPEFLKLPPFQYIRTITGSRNGDVLLGTWGSGLIGIKKSVEDAKDIQSVFSYEVLLPDVKITSIAQDESGIIWAGTYDEGIIQMISGSSIPGRHNRTVKNPAGLEIEDVHITSLMMDKGNKLWIGTKEKGFYIYDINSDNTRHYYSEPYSEFSLKGNFISTLYTDQTGKIWLGANGLALYNPQSNQLWAQYPSGIMNSLIDPVVWCFESHDETQVWIGTEAGGIQLFHPESGYIQSITADNSKLAGNNIRALTKDNRNRLWIGHFNKGLQVMDCVSGSFKTIPEMESLQIQDMTLCPYNWLWVGTIRSGLYRHHILNGITEQIIPAGSATEWPDQLTINSVNTDKQGNIWVCTRGEGVFILDHNANLITHLTNTGKPGEGLVSNLVNSMYEDSQGSFWLGTHMGVNHIRKKENNLPPSSNNLIISSDIIPPEIFGQVIYSIQGDNTSRLWISTNTGLKCYSPGNQSVYLYGPEEGSQGYEFNSNASFSRSDGMLFFGGISGFNYFFPDQIKPVMEAPIARIVSIYLSGNSLNPDSIQQSKSMRLKHRQNNLGFEFSVFDYPLSARNQYQTKLNGLENEWQNQGSRRYINYAGLRPGFYTFLIRGSNKYGIWGNEADMFSFRILPPFWRSGWFISIVIFLIGLLVYAWHLARLKRALEIEKLRTRISGDLHDDIGASLTRISLYSDLLKNEKTNEKHTEYLGKIGTLSREVISSMSDIVWAIDARRDNLPDLTERIKGSALDITSGMNITVNFDFSGLTENLSIRPHLRQNIYLVYKEALHNAVKHSVCDRIDISLTLDHGYLVLAISDNGIGFKLNEPVKGNGLLNMKRRAELIKGKLDVKKEKGTRIQLTVKI